MGPENGYRPGGVTRAELGAYTEQVAAAVTDILPGYSSIIWKGSAFKPWDGPYDFLPGLSDLDIHVYRDGGISSDAFAVRRQLRRHLGPAPMDMPIQLLVLDTRTLPDWWTLLPGTFQVIAGTTPPVPIPSPDLLFERDRMGLVEAAGHAEQLAAGLLAVADDLLWEYLRSVRWMFPPVLYRALTVIGVPAEKVWAMNRTEVDDAAAHDRRLDGLRRHWTGYLDAALGACTAGGTPRTAERALIAGDTLLRLAAEWIAEQPDAPVERRAPVWWQTA